MLDNEGKAVIDFNTTNNGILMMKHSIEAGWDSILYIWLDGKWENYDKISDGLDSDGLDSAGLDKEKLN